MQQNLLLVVVSLLCGSYVWCAVLANKRAQQRKEQQHYLRQAGTLCATLAPTLRWQANFETFTMKGGRFGSMEGYDDRGRALLNLRWNLATEQLVSVGIPSSEAATEISMGASVPVRTETQAAHRALELLGKLGQTRWQFASRLVRPARCTQNIWTLTYAASASKPGLLAESGGAGKQQAVIKLDAKQGALRFFRVFDLHDRPGQVPRRSASPPIGVLSSQTGN